MVVKTLPQQCTHIIPPIPVSSLTFIVLLLLVVAIKLLQCMISFEDGHESNISISSLIDWRLKNKA